MRDILRKVAHGIIGSSELSHAADALGGRLIIEMGLYRPYTISFRPPRKRWPFLAQPTPRARYQEEL